MLCFKELNIIRGLIQVPKSMSLSKLVFSLARILHHFATFCEGKREAKWLKWLLTGFLFRTLS